MGWLSCLRHSVPTKQLRLAAVSGLRFLDMDGFRDEIRIWMYIERERVCVCVCVCVTERWLSHGGVPF